MYKLITLIAAMTMVSCATKLSSEKYDQVYIGDNLHSTKDNSIEIFKNNDLFYFVFFQRGDNMGEIKATLDTIYRKDGIIHFNYYSIDGENVIDATPRRVDIYNIDGPNVSYRKLKK